MLFIINDKEFETKLELIEQACVSQFGKMKFALCGQVDTVTRDSDKKDVTRLRIAILNKNEFMQIKDILSKREHFNFENELDCRLL